MKKIDRYSDEAYEDEEGIDIKDILSSLWRYKKSILGIALLAAMIAAYRAYFAPPVYMASTLLKIDNTGYKNNNGFLAASMQNDVNEIENEVVIFKSYNIAKKAIEKLHIGTRYFTKEDLRIVELYKDSPFVVTSRYLAPELYGAVFKLTPVDKNHFRLAVAKKQVSIKYDAVHSYGEKIDSEWFSLSIQKVFTLDRKEYTFTIVPNERMVDFVKNRISATMVTKHGNILRVSFVDNVPLRAKEIVNRVADAYAQNNLEQKSESAKKQLNFIDRQLEAIDRSLKGSADKLQKYKASNIVVDINSKAQMTASKLSDLESKLYEINMQIDIMESILNHIKSHKDISSINMDYSQQSNPAISSLLEEIQKSIAKYATLSVNYTEKHPEIIVAKRQIESLKKSLIDALRSNLRTLKNSRSRLLDIISVQKQALKSLPEKEQELGELTRSFMINEKIHSFLLEKRAETAIIKSSTISNTHIIEAARTPGTPIKPRRGLMLLIGIAIGFALGIGQAFLRIYLDDSIKTSEDIEKLTKVPLYGILPLLKSEKLVPYYREAVRGLWINLAFLKTRNKSKIISITSSVSGEGKTFTIYHLSRVIAHNRDKSVIVLDLDMRRASLHKNFGIDNTDFGMSTLLLDKCTLEDAITKTDNENLDLITSGPVTSNPTGLIMSIVLESIIKKLSQKYDYIFLDTPPIGLVPDATKIMHLSDITLFVVRADRSTKEYIKDINRLNEKEEINLGIVLNGVNFGNKYGYGYKSEYINGYLTK